MVTAVPSFYPSMYADGLGSEVYYAGSKAVLLPRIGLLRWRAESMMFERDQSPFEGELKLLPPGLTLLKMRALRRGV